MNCEKCYVYYTCYSLCKDNVKIIPCFDFQPITEKECRILWKNDNITVNKIKEILNIDLITARLLVKSWNKIDNL